jgi:hypothetical protein
MRISEEQYLGFKARYDEINKKMQEIEAKWRNI